MKCYFWLFFLPMVTVASQQQKINFNPYEVLNVDRAASSSDIRSSYKKLAKEWHPDKNKAPNAQDKFIEIQQAYEILSDENKREQYDTGGYSSDSISQWQSYGEPFSFSYSDFTFDFTDSEGATQTLSLHDYYSRVIPESHHTPHLIYVYSTFCGRCILWLRTHWQQAANDLKALGVAVYTVDTTFTSRIASSLGVSKVPTIVGLYKERSYFFKGQITKHELKTFVLSFMPADIITKVTSSNAQKFLAGIKLDDKPRVLLFSEKSSPTLLYTLMSVKFERYFSFGHVDLRSGDSEGIVKNFGVNRYGPTLLVFKENKEKPSVVLGASEMPKGAINDILSANKYLTVPRLTSQFVLDEICPAPHGAVHDVRLCMILVTDPSYTNHDTITINLKQLVEEVSSKDDNLNDWLTFMRVYTSTQPAFTQSLLSEEIKQSKLMLLWRRGNTMSSVQELDIGFLMQTFSFAKEGFQICLRTALEYAHLQRFQSTVTLSPLVDELAPGTILQILRGVVTGVEYILSIFTNLGEHKSMILVMLAVLTFILFSGENTGGQENENRQSGGRSNTRPGSNATDENGQVNPSASSGDTQENVASANKGSNKSGTSSTEPSEIKEITIPQSTILELSPTTYESLVLKQSRGQLTVILLCNQELATTVSLIENYQQAMKVFERDPKLSVTYLDVKKFSSWYSEIRRTASAEPPGENKITESMSSLHGNGDFDRIHESNSNSARSSESIELINGTVLALNGLKHWFCMFVPRGVKWGLPKSTEATSEESYVDMLQCWMDRVREGQMPRLYVRQWPGLYAREQFTQDEDEF